MNNLILIGGGNQCSYTIDIIEKQNKYNIVGIIDSIKNKGETIFGYEVLGNQTELKYILEKFKVNFCLITIGDNWSRYLVYNEIKKISPELSFINAIHPSVIIGKGVEMGVGIVAMAGCIFNTNSKIGDFTFFATGAQVEHDNTISDFSSISAGSITGGFVKIGKFSAITLGVTIMDRVEIGENVVVGSGSLVTKSLSNDSLYYGNPVKFIRNRNKGEKFLK